ncbi:unnamed protein product [Euphydryas editha]|uniref:Endonuclease/exonuclease/phosphatase domain-containing protein n=1 Tax=Euphydryas editha TaxID=104508 RepID=A0AAU9TMB4_EUPED|nr:unnamed protein product [Euphydryas editha]
MYELDNIQIAQSNFHTINDFSRHTTIQKSDFTIISQNIRSIYNNFDDLLITLSEFKFQADLITLTEGWIDPHKPIPQMDNYTHFVTSRHINRSDGVVVYIKCNHKTIVQEINLKHASCLQVKVGNYTILCIYRSPSNLNAENFINSLNTHLVTLHTQNNIIITGDININLIQKSSETSQERSNRLHYLNTLATHGLLPGHTLPTRDRSCIDHFILKLDRYMGTCASITVLDSTVTDHKMLFLKPSYLAKSNYNTSKIKSSINMEGALTYLKNSNITDLIYYNNPIILTNKLISILKQCILSNTITRTIPNKKRLIKPWITLGIVRCIRNRNAMQAKLRADPHNEILKITYRRYRNFCNSVIKKVKRKYEKEDLAKSIKNPKTLWKKINTLTYRNQPKTQNLELLNLNASPQNSVNSVNDYFSNIGKNLAKEIIPVTTLHNRADIISPNCSQVSSFVLLETDPHEVYLTIMSLKTDSAPGWDGVSTKFLKYTRELCSCAHNNSFG